MTALIVMPPPRLPAVAEGEDADARVPALPALTRVLQRSRRLPDAPDWRAAVVGALGGDYAAPSVAVAARSIDAPLPPGTPLCFAAPVHVVAGLSRVHLPPGGRLQLDLAEERAWCTSFNAEFEPHGARLHIAAPGGGWILEAAFASAARDLSPDALEGEPLRREPARDASERALRRLGAEVEIWLASHALNRAREAQRLPPLTAVWCWGGATMTQLPPLYVEQLVLAHSTADAWIAGLAAHAAVTPTLASHWDELATLPASRAARGRCSPVVLLPPQSVGFARHWEEVEQNWIRPAAAALQAGRIAALRVQIGSRAWQLPGSGLHWLIPRRRSWWQLAEAG